MAKKKTIPKLIDDCWKVFSKYTRLRDAIRTTGDIYYLRCITCKDAKEIPNCDAGHWRSRAYRSTLFHEQNVHGQCKSCNGFYGGKPEEYKEEIIKMYGEEVADEIYYLSKQTKKFTEGELEAMIAHYKEHIKYMEKHHKLLDKPLNMLI